MQRPPMLKPRPNFSDLRGEGVLRTVSRRPPGAARVRRGFVAPASLAFQRRTDDHKDNSKRGTGR